MKKILVINGHPREKSLSDSLAQAYAEGAKASGVLVDQTHIRDLKFNALADPSQIQDLEPDLLMAQTKIKDCDHLCIVFPTWWTSVPAVTKGFLDRTFLANWAFKYSAAGMPVGLLKGRSARIIHTSGAPSLVNKWFYGEPEIRMMKKGVLDFCGFKPVSVTKIGSVTSRDKKFLQHIEVAREMGKRDSKKIQLP
jgi:NAD(P)H dehydrogenase (quinone)